MPLSLCCCVRNFIAMELTIIILLLYTCPTEGIFEARHTSHVRWLKTARKGRMDRGLQDVANRWEFILQDMIIENQQKIDKLEDLRLNNMNALGFEVGYLCAAIHDKLRRMNDLYAYTKKLESKLYRNEHLILLDECEQHYWEIEHMVNMMYEIERKEGIRGDFEPNYADTFADLILIRNVTTTTRWRVTITKALKPAHISERLKKEGQIMKHIKLGVLRGKGDGAKFFLKRNTPKVTPKNFKKNYGWGIDYFW